MPGLFITGTDTDVGKTFATCAMLHALCSAGVSAVGMKPVASGCSSSAGGWRNADAVALIASSSFAPDYELVNPLALPDATAPEFAARAAGISISLPPLRDAYQQLAAQAEIVLVEGVGGWLSPLSERLMQADLVECLDLPVLLVVGLRLGCINHALLTEAALSAAGRAPIAWLASACDPDLTYADETFNCLCERLASPCLGRLGWNRRGDAKSAACDLDTDALLRIVARR